MDRYFISRALITGYLCSLSDLKTRFRSVLLELRHLQQTSAAFLDNDSGDFFRKITMQDRRRSVDELDMPKDSTDGDFVRFIRASQKLRANAYADIWHVHELRHGTNVSELRRELYAAIAEIETIKNSKIKKIVDSIVKNRKLLLGSQLSEGTLKAQFSGLVDENLVDTEVTELCEIISSFQNRYMCIEDQRFPGLLDYQLNVSIRDSESLTNSNIRYFIFAQSYLRHRLTSYVTTMRCLQDQLGQLIENTNPLHPIPVLRRRQENAVDAYFMGELTRWTHRDLANFFENYLKVKLPNKNMPITLQYWDYDSTSRHSSILGSKDLELRNNAWKREQCNSLNDDKRVQHISIIKNSYWLNDKPDIIPIIGHELSHQLLESLFSPRIAEWHLVEVTRVGLIGDLIRRLKKVMDDWGRYSRYIEPNIHLEICCDLVATARFGFSYLFAWFIEMMRGGQYEEECSLNEFELLDVEQVIFNSKFPRRVEVPDLSILLRGQALTQFLEAVVDSPDCQEIVLLNCVNNHLDLLLKIRMHDLPVHEKYWKKCVDKLRLTIKKSGFVSVSEIYMENWRAKNSSPDWFSERQRLSQSFLDATCEESEFLKCTNLATITDIHWKYEWQLNAFPNKSLSVDPRYIFSAAVEDYIFKTFHPDGYFSLLPKKDRAIVAKKLNFEHNPNLRDEAQHKKEWQNARDLVGLKAQKTNGTPVFRARFRRALGCKEVINYVPSEWFKKAKCRHSYLELRLITGPEVNWVRSPHGSPILYGRYDEYLLEEIKNKNSSTYWPQATTHHAYAYLTRRRLLKPISRTDGRSEISSFLFVVLKRRAFRLPFISWMKENFPLDTYDSLDIYLSSGWEDFVLASRTNFFGIFELSNIVFDCAYVQRTETMCTQFALDDVDDGDGNKELYITIYFRIRVSLEKFEKWFNDELVKEFDNIGLLEYELTQSIGPMDYCLRLKSMTNTKETVKGLREFLHDSTQISRIETSFSIRPTFRSNVTS